MVRGLIFLFVAILLGGCDLFDNEAEKKSNSLDLKSLEVLKASDQFGWELLNTMNQMQMVKPGKNLVISSLSVAQALGMTTNGANGSTLDEMVDVLGFDNVPVLNEANKNIRAVLSGADDKVELEIANSVWYRQTLPAKEEFKNIVEQYYNAVFRGLDFNDVEGSKKVINGWVNDKTRGKIPTIVENITPTHTMFLINAVYFLGKWQYQFSKEETRDEPFFLSDGRTVTVSMMSQKATLDLFDGENLRAVRIPYGNGSFYMMVLLPSGNNDVDGLISQMNPEKWDVIRNGFQEKSVNLFLPRFETACKYKLKAPLVEMGMGLAFSDFADFSKMIDTPVMIGEVRHKTFIRVDEEGTEAAAVTSVEMELTSVGGSDKWFRVDRPFLFAIAEKKSGAILFAGKIENPLLKD